MRDMARVAVREEDVRPRIIDRQKPAVQLGPVGRGEPRILEIEFARMPVPLGITRRHEDQRVFEEHQHQQQNQRYDGQRAVPAQTTCHDGWDG